MEFAFSAAELAGITSASLIRGDPAACVRAIASLGKAVAGDLSFLSAAKYRTQLQGCRASVLLLQPGTAFDPGPGQAVLEVTDPSRALSQICARLEPLLWPRPAAGIHPSATVDPAASVPLSAVVGPHCVVEAGAQIGERAWLQARVHVGRGSRVGEDAWLAPGAVIYPECSLGRRVRLHAGVVIGADGFGYELEAGRHAKVPQVGGVEIGDDVEIGANSCVDRARFGQTVVGEGTKIDNLVQVGHNVVIGRHCLIVSQVGIAGSTTLEDYVVLAGQAGLNGHITVGKGAQIAAQAGVAQSVEPGAVVWGSPAIPILLERRLAVLRQRLPEVFRRLDALEAARGDIHEKKPS